MEHAGISEIAHCRKSPASRQGETAWCLVAGKVGKGVRLALINNLGSCPRQRDVESVIHDVGTVERKLCQSGMSGGNQPISVDRC